MGDPIQEAREVICTFAYDLFDRHLTDPAGGNLSIRVDDVILMTPRYAGTRWHWRLRPEQILKLDLDGNKIDGEGDVSREYKVHHALLKHFYPVVTSVIHAHSRNVMVFCAAEQEIYPVLYSTYKFGTIPQVTDAPSGSDELAEYVLEGMLKQPVPPKVNAAGVMAPRHGLVVMGKSIYEAFDAVERIDTNAYCLLMGKSLGEITPFRQPAKINPNYE